MIALGVDIGGTSIKGAAIKDDGTLLDSFSLPMDKKASPEVSFLSMCKVIENFLKNKEYKDEIVGIGLGVPGILDKEKGIIKYSPNMPLWDNFKIVDFVQKRLDLPVKILNDASSAALGEARFGTGKNFHNIIMITLGTGVGGGIIIEDELFDGNEGAGAQIGHSIVELNGRQCSCGRKGCLEAYASATALNKEANLQAKKHPESLLHTYSKIGCKEVFDAARKGDETSIKVVDEYIKYLSEGILNFCKIFRPEIILLSGGVANEGQYLVDRVTEYIKVREYGYKHSPEVLIKIGALGYDAGKYGAASLFFKK